MASPEFVSGDPGTQFLPFAASTGGPDVSGSEGLAQQRDLLCIQDQRLAARHIYVQNICNFGRRNRIPCPNAVIVAMACGFLQHWLADLVGSVDDPDRFAGIYPLDDTAVILDEVRCISLAEIGQHAEQVMRSDGNCHDLLMARSSAVRN